MDRFLVGMGKNFGRIWLAFVLGLAMTASAQSITPANWTSETSNLKDDNAVRLWLSQPADNTLEDVSPILGLTVAARTSVPSSGLQGTIFFTTTTTREQNIPSEDIVIISCDSTEGYLPASTVFSSAVEANVTAILLYSQTADYCSLQDYDNTNPWIYSMKSQKDTAHMLNSTLENGEMHAAIRSVSSQSSSSHSNNNDSNSLEHSPTTAVAMIILYSVTGVITGLFLIIVFTGAMRAHRHPERYGPSSALGRPRQSRARGLARAMLDTLPIVKFGQNEGPKPADVEMADSNTQTTGRPEATERDVGATEQQATHETSQPQTEGGIAAAVAVAQPTSQTDDPDHQGCSICTEDFEAGQDQRVLPCDHRFHPDCIDPWLLNVSGTCPLCRIDLRPQTSRTSDSGEVDENGEPILREGVFEPPPLNSQDPGNGDRRRFSTAFLDRMGIGRPDRLTREERVLALRRMRGQRLARQRREEASAEPANPESPEEESSTRRRLRRVFGVRTRTTNEHGEPAEEAEESEPRP